MLRSIGYTLRHIFCIQDIDQHIYADICDKILLWNLLTTNFMYGHLSNYVLERKLALKLTKHVIMNRWHKKDVHHIWFIARNPKTLKNNILYGLVNSTVFAHGYKQTFNITCHNDIHMLNH